MIHLLLLKLYLIVTIDSLCWFSNMSFLYLVPILRLSSCKSVILDLAGLETYFFSHSQTFASGFNLNSQIAVSNSQLVFPTFEKFLTLRCGMAIASWGWNLVHRSPLRWQRTCCNPYSSFLCLRNTLFLTPLPSHSKTASLCYEALRLFHCFYCRLAETSLRPRSGFGIR